MADGPEGPPERGTILVIEDDLPLVRLLVEVLEDADYRYLTAVTAAEALEVARAERPNLILLDLGLPGMDGVDLSRQVRADAALAHIPIIAMSAPAQLRRALGVSSIDAGVAKPCALEELVAVLARWI